jgi:iron(III) transport system permease protein
LAARRAPFILIAAGSVVAVGMILPLAYLSVRVLGAGPDFLGVVATSKTAQLTARTLALVLGVVAAAVGISIPYAWLVVRSDLPGRRLWALLGCLPLVFPSYVAAFALVAFFGPRGHLRGWLAPLGIERLPDFAYGYGGALAALALFTYPYILLLLIAGLRNLDPAVEESARSLGSSRLQAFFRVALPQLRGPLAAGSLLVALYALSDFGAVSIARYNTFTLSIYNAYRTLFDRGVAASLALVLVMMTLAILAGQSRLAGRARRSRTRPFRRSPTVPLGRWRLPATLALAALNLVTLAVPLGVIVHWALLAMRAGNPMGAAWQATANSLLAASLAALVCTVLALPIAIWVARYPDARARTAERLTQSGYALPGLVVALALVFFSTRHAPSLYQTLAILVTAYVIRFLPQALGAARSSLAALSPRFEEAARSLGRGRLAVLRTITLPLVTPGLTAGAGLVFLTTMKELPATLILRPTGFETLATRIWSATTEGIYSQAAVPAMALLAASAVPIYLLVIRPVLDAGRGA